MVEGMAWGLGVVAISTAVIVGLGAFFIIKSAKK